MKLTLTFDSDEEKAELLPGLQTFFKTEDEATTIAAVEAYAKKSLRQPFFRGGILAQRRNREAVFETPGTNIRGLLTRSKEIFGGK